VVRSLHHSLMPRVALPALALLIALPLVMQAIGQPFYTVLATRILIFALAASA
jgi:branched-chain amino acid transport system permease protein